MSGRPRLIPQSIRARLLGLILVVAVAPLVLIGIWQSQSAARAGDRLLRSELEQSIDRVAEAAALRWSYRSGDIATLASNDVARHLLVSSIGAPLSPPDSAYLAQLAVDNAKTIDAFEYYDGSAALRWRSPTTQRDTSTPNAPAPLSPPSIVIRTPVLNDSARTIGTMVARVHVSALTPLDSTLWLPNGARLQVVERATSQGLLPGPAPESLLRRERFDLRGEAWLAVRRSMADPAVDLVLAAPHTAYVKPFQRVARTGGAVLVVVALSVLLVSFHLTGKVTASLERLAAAADSVAAGNLQHRVTAEGSSEVRRVGGAFNSMADNLQRTLAELSQRQALAAVGEYAAALSHDVRNGLTAVRLDLQSAEERMPADSAGRPQLVRALESVNRVDRTVSASLRASRGNRAPRRRIDLRVLAARTLTGVDGLFAAHGVKLLAEVAGSPAWTFADAVAVEQLLVNLLINAMQATAAGGSVTITVTTGNGEALLAVSDCGVGIPSADLERVFEPFFSTKDDGTGLGLATVRQTATSHGGAASISSEVGVGTKVTVRLPLAGGDGPSELS